VLIIGDESKSNGKIPWVTFCLIGLNILVFCAQVIVGPSLMLGFSLIPKEITTLTDLTKPERVRAKVPTRVRGMNGKFQTSYRDVSFTVPQAPGPYPIFLTLVTSMFLHGSWGHLAGNMWFLAIFGRNVECALNHGRFLAFYVCCGVASGLVYTMTDASSVIPCVGASGAISGVLGAYVAIHPLNPISIWVSFVSILCGFWCGVIKVPAIIVVGLWFIFQYVAAFLTLEYGGTNAGGTAYWAHIGGFLAGIAIIRGTVAYLKWKMANEPRDDDAALASEHQEVGMAENPFDNFLPPSKAVHGVETTAEHKAPT
jgi:membrane associated rhomboid family serine protease